MSAPGSPPETGTIISSDDRYPFSAFPIADDQSEFDALRQSVIPNIPGAGEPLTPSPPSLFGGPLDKAPVAEQMQTLDQKPSVTPQMFSPDSVGKAVDRALGLEGMHERVNQADIQEYLRTGGVNMDPAKAAWCAAFVRASLKAEGIDVPGATNVATSFLNVGEAAETPQKGDILVQPRGRLPGDLGGHVGFATGRIREGVNGLEYEMFSGNQGNRAVRSWERADTIQVRRLGSASPVEAPRPVVAEQIPAKDELDELMAWDQDALSGFEPQSAVPSQMLGAFGQIPDEPLAPVPENVTDIEPMPISPELTIPPLPPLETTVSYGPGTPINAPQASQALFKPVFDSNKPLDIPLLDRSTRGVRQTGRGVLGLSSIPYDVAGGLTSIVALPARAAGWEGPAHAAEWLFERGQSAKRGAGALMGLDPHAPPENIVEELAYLGGESLFPAGKYTAALTGLLTGMRAAAPLVITPAEAAAKRRKEESDAFAGMLDKGNLDTTRLVAPANVIYLKEPDGTVTVVPQASRYGNLNLPPDKAIEQYRRVGLNFGRFENEEAARTYMTMINDRVVIPMVPTTGGPANIKNSELALMGALGVVSIGAMFAPQIFNMFRRSTPRLGRTVEDAAPGTQAFSNRGDLARTYDDVNAGALRVAGDVVRDRAVLKTVTDAFTIQTRGAASNIADSAVMQGRAEGPNFQFRARVPLGELERTTNPEIAQYLHLRDTFDDLQREAQLRANQTAQRIPVAPGPATVRGMTEAQVLQEIGALEAANPALRQIGAAYRDNLKQLRRFEATGEFATTTSREFRRLNAENPNEVPFVGSRRVLDDPNVERPSPFAALGEDMRTRMRFRMENEAKGLYVDAMRRAEPSTFRRVSSTQLERNPTWKRNTVTIYRRGKPEHYTTDPFLADILRMDPYYFQNPVVNFMHTTKRGLEMGTTGMLAPWFADTSMLRSHQIAKATGPTQGLEAPNILQTFAAIPRQLIPQMSRSLSRTLDQGSGGWMGQVFGQAYLDSLSTRLMTVYRDSLFAKLEAAGSHRGSIIEHQIRSPNSRHWQRLSQTNNAVLNRAISATTGTTRAFLHGWRATFGAIHNAPAYAFARRNQGALPMPELAARVRNMTGDPTIGGQFMTDRHAIRFQNQGPLDAAKTLGVQSYGAVTEFGRIAVPWFNPMMQGAKRIGQAYLDNPKKFVGQVWLYTQMPAMAAYFWNRSAGNDPNGVPYVDYMMNGRSQYNTMMNYYLAVPGKPASEGIQLSRFHELAPAARMMEIALDHAMRSNKFTMKEDFLNAAGNSVKIIFSPATPPLVNLGFATQGMVGPQGIFEGEAYRVKESPFDQNTGLPTNLEMYARAIAPGIAEVVGAGAAAAIQADEGRSRVGAFFEEAGKRAISKAPVTRIPFGIQPPATGNTRYVEELFNKQRSLRQLDQFYKKWGLSGGDHEINTDLATKPRSVAGSRIAEHLLGRPIPSEVPGLGQPEPTNPLYKMFAEELHDKFMRDDPKTGGMGFQSVWRRYSNATEALRSLRKVNAGNYVTWQRQLEARPEAMAFLRENGVNYKDVTAVKNFYEVYRQNAAKELLFAIRAVEHEFSQRLGRPIKLENLDPYNKRGLTIEAPLDVGAEAY